METVKKAIILYLQEAQEVENEDDMESLIPHHDSTPSGSATGGSLKRKRKSNKVDEQTDEILTMVSERLRKNTTNNDDPLDIYGKHVAAKLRSLPKQTRIYTEKLINDIIFEAEMGNVDKNTKILMKVMIAMHVLTTVLICSYRNKDNKYK